MTYCDTDLVLQEPNILGKVDFVDWEYAAAEGEALEIGIKDNKVILAPDQYTEVHNADLHEVTVSRIVASLLPRIGMKDIQLPELFFVS